MHFSSGAAFAAALLLAGCATNPVPEGYKGAVARVVDTIEPNGRTSANIFFVEEFDGHRIDNASAYAARANSGNGFRFQVYQVDFGRSVPAAPATFTITGYVYYPTPIQTLFMSIHKVTGTVSFTPEPDGDYTVTGKLGKEHSAVWIEDTHTHKLVGQKVEN